MRRVVSASCVVLAAIGCERPDDLGFDTTSGAGGATTTSSHSSSTSSSAGSTSSGAGGAVEPIGPSALTVVNGIADYPATLFCFLPGDTPWPAAAGGLAFAAGQVVDLASAFPSGSDVTPWVIAGDLAATSGMTCTQILALAQPTDGGAAPSVLATALGVIPQSVLAADRSLLLVPTGCMGGTGHDAAAAPQGCGTGYTSQTPTTGVVLVAMSRITDAKHVSLQAVNASAVLAASDIGVTPNVAKATEVVVAPALTPGGIGPEPPFAGLALAQYGTLSGVQLGTYPPGGSTATATVSLGDVLTASTVGTAGFVDGANLVLVAVGGGATVPAGAFWQAMTFAVVNGAP